MKICINDGHVRVHNCTCLSIAYTDMKTVYRHGTMTKRMLVCSCRISNYDARNTKSCEVMTRGYLFISVLLPSLTVSLIHTSVRDKTML
jgi:hypothetical protein